jgi:hypothetical protein
MSVKAAIVSTGSTDYLIDIVADGMLRLLGQANVHLDYNRRAPHDSRYSQLFMGFQYENGFKLDEADVLVTSVRTPLSVPRGWMSRTGKNKVAVLDGEDDTVLRSTYMDLSKVYFKREFLKGRTHPKNVQPLPFGAIPETVPAAEKRDIPVFWCCMVRNKIRLDVSHAVREMGYDLPEGRHENTMTVGGLTGKAHYNERLARAQVGISAAGAGWDTYRYWEVPYFGALLLSQRLGIVIPGDFNDGLEALYFDTAKEMQAKLGAVMSDPPRLKAIAEAGARAVQERHLSIHRAKKVLEVLG